MGARQQRGLLLCTLLGQEGCAEEHPDSGVLQFVGLHCLITVVRSDSGYSCTPSCEPQSCLWAWGEKEGGFLASKLCLMILGSGSDLRCVSSFTSVRLGLDRNKQVCG